jgi:hypothetical protein
MAAQPLDSAPKQGGVSTNSGRLLNGRYFVFILGNYLFLEETKT